MILRWRLLALVIAGSLAVGLGGCPDNPYESDTWIEKLGDSNEDERERAVTQLEQLGDPKAIPALGRAWKKNNKPQRYLQVMIDLARPVLAEKMTEDEKEYLKPRDAHWELAQEFLVEAVNDVDSANPRSIDSAILAAEAIGEAKLEGGIDALMSRATEKLTAKDPMLNVQRAAILALGKFGNQPQVVDALTAVLKKEPDEQPPQIFGVAVLALADVKSPKAVDTLVETMYRIPPLFDQIRRALVASGGEVGAKMKKILRGEDAAVNALFSEKKLDNYCVKDTDDIDGDGNAAEDICKPVSLKDYYAAILIGDLYDVSAIPDLLEALKKPARPAYYVNWNEGPSQHNGILDSLRKIGDPKSADDVKALWSNPKTSEMLRPLAAQVYGFLARDTSALGELGKLVEDDKVDQALRISAADSYARLGNTKDHIALLMRMAAKYQKAADEAQAKANGPEKAAYDKAKAAYDEAKTQSDEAAGAVLKAGGPAKAPVELLNDATAKKTKLDDKKKAMAVAKGGFTPLQQRADGLRGYQRMFEQHVARIEIALRCGSDPACYGKTLSTSTDDVIAKMSAHVKGIDKWTKDEQKELRVAQIERGMMELGKLGSKAESLTPLLLTEAKSDDRLVRQSILLALPKVAKKPCDDCVKKLDEAIAAGEGKSTLGDLNVQTAVLRNYFAWAGKSGSAPPAAEKP